MMLLFDLGNSRCKWQLRDGDTVVAAGGAAYTGEGRLPDHLLAAVADLPHAPERAVACSVATPAVLAPLEERLRVRYGCTLEHFRTAAEGAGVRNAYAEPGNLGADRWAALLGGHARYEGRLCIADCGTAVTLDVLEADGRHAGGVILPGLSLARRALSLGAHRLADPGDGPLPALAADTPTAIRAGTFHGLVAAIDSFKMRCDEAGGVTRGLITGGDAPTVAAALSGRWQVDADLVFTGMAVGIESGS
ncbi:type III pantothenate kinase [Aquisalimonas lutea]|uniref:type III pantothenate kinase n=1 Tax=Aquisalimonas lutea TaxID=1327750 RepID=UPI0025B4BF82|nr:type III pantothenate kinase [Aquisalimonas lutea]MDN3517023.1 type III pantothenate kinase [Aquisalimonas lutea]